MAVAAAIIVAGVATSGGEADAGSSGTPSTGALPSDHPSIAGVTDDGEPTEESLKDLEAKRADAPGDVGVLLDLGEAYFYAQRLDEAERTYNEALDMEPENTAGQVGRALVWHAQGRSKKAETALRRALKDHPDDQEAHFSLAIVCFSDGRVDEAKHHWQAAADIDSQSDTGKRSQSFVDLLENRRSGSSEADD